ncbi:glycosyltransferase family 4 protein [Gemmatimonas sp.]|jgi:glycosyltransferase involved in cell wall biosynthesis|uniref:glycosyltransferase family 4 protein n=1 Tax=Gemmatimonas sp. TaxID=1962908 RepID=UPI0037BEBC96
MSDCSHIRLALFSDTFAPQVNGVARTLDRLVTALRERGGEVRVFTTDDPDATERHGVQRFPSRSFWAYPQLQLAWPKQREVRAALRDFRPSLVHAATEFGVGLAGRRAALTLGVPFVSSYHTSFTAYAAHYGLGALAVPGWSYLRWFHNVGRRTYCPTMAIVDEVTAHGFTHCREWSRGVDSTRFAPRFRSTAFRESIGATDDTLVAAYVGRIAPEKNVSVALDAMRAVSASRPEAARLVVVGDGPFEQTAREAAPEGSVFTGRLEGQALSEVYASADVLLFPSTTDTFGNVMLEAMASGTPVIGADVAPTREVLLPGRGWVCKAGDADALAQQLITLIDDRTALVTMRALALQFAQSRSWTAVWDTLFADYLSVQRAGSVREATSALAHAL